MYQHNYLILFSEVWAVTFSNIASELIPDKLKAVLKQCASPGLRTQVVNIFSIHYKLDR